MAADSHPQQTLRRTAIASFGGWACDAFDYQLGTSIYRWQNVAWDDSLLPDSGGSRCVNRDFSDYRII